MSQTFPPDGPTESESRAGAKVMVFLILAAFFGCIIAYHSLGRGGSRPAARDTSGLVMYFCGIDRCRDSGEYGELVFRTGISVWNAPAPNRGGVRRTAKHHDKAEVTDQRRVSSGPGGLWYELKGGGWVNDYWLTTAPCTPDNLADFSFTDCVTGRY